MSASARDREAVPPLPRPLVREAVRTALLEDLGRAGDVTSAAVIPEGTIARLAVRARQPGRLAGLDLAEAAFAELEPALRFSAGMRDGDRLEPGATLTTVEGDARAILGAERVALNFLGRLCGIASLTDDFVARVRHTRARICCTRKTTPGLRAFEKHAVRSGGGFNHRFGLDDAVLIKDNHVAIAGGVRTAVRRAKASVGHLVKIEVEVDDLGQIEEALAEGADAILLDNMGPDLLREAVRLVAGRAVLEASGGISLGTVGAVAESGVDYISSGALTHSAPSLDIGLDYL